MGFKTDKADFSIKKLPSLTNLSFSIAGTIDEDILTRLLDQLPHIQRLCLHGNFSYFNLDNLVNLKVLSLDGFTYTIFNYELFKNLCSQLENINIRLNNINEKEFFKLFDGYNFPYLVNLTIEHLKMKRLKKKFINR